MFHYKHSVRSENLVYDGYFPNIFSKGCNRLSTLKEETVLSETKPHEEFTKKRYLGRTAGGALGSVLLTMVTSSHQWASFIVLAFGLGAVGSGLRKMATQEMFPNYVQNILIVVSLVVSAGMLFVAWRIRKRSKFSAWVYFTSSVISLLLMSVYLLVFFNHFTK